MQIIGEPGNMRTVRRFLFLPRKLRGEIRWLEFSQIRQEYMPSSFNDTCPGYWVDREWVDEELT